MSIVTTGAVYSVVRQYGYRVKRWQIITREACNAAGLIMAFSPGLKNKLLAVTGSSALIISTLLLNGEDGFEGRQHRPYKDVTGIWTVCNGHTGHDIVSDKIYTEAECNDRLHADPQSIKRRETESMRCLWYTSEP